MLIATDWYWLILIDAEWCGLMLIDADADWCWLILIYVDWCWLMLIDTDWCWFMQICAQIRLTRFSFIRAFQKLYYLLFKVLLFQRLHYICLHLSPPLKTHKTNICFSEITLFSSSEIMSFLSAPFCSILQSQVKYLLTNIFFFGSQGRRHHLTAIFFCPFSS